MEKGLDDQRKETRTAQGTLTPKTDGANAVVSSNNPPGCEAEADKSGQMKVNWS